MDIRDFNFHRRDGSENVTLKVNLDSFVKWACHSDSHAKIILSGKVDVLPTKAIAFFTISLQLHNRIL